MSEHLTKALRLFAFAAALLLGALALDDALAERSWGPILQVAWLPAVLVGAFGAPAQGRRCVGRLRRCLS